MHLHHAWSRRATTILLASLLALALIAAGCSDDGDSSSPDDSTAAGGEADADGGEQGAFPEVEVDPDHRPIIFVHGSSGSGAQFQSQALRFASNGYPIEYLDAVDYNSPEVESSDVDEQIDELIAELQEISGQDQVDLMGHSLGTVVSNDYLTSDPARAANVAHYVNIDGGAWPEPPGGVETLALWGEPGFGPRSEEGADDDIPGAENVHFEDQAHVEVATSPESFEEMYAFFNDGEAPETTEILPEEEITLEGRAVHFPQNEGVPEGELQVYEVDPDTGFRLDEEPEDTFPLAGDGEWGPFVGEHDASYEMVIVRNPEDRPHHFYLQPLTRSDHLIRLNSSPPQGGIGDLLEQHAGSTSIVVSRYRELWGDQGEGSDVLEVDGQNVVNEAVSPRDKNGIGIFLFDQGGDGQSNLDEPIASLFGIGFLTGADLFIPAASPPDRTVSVTVVPRGDEEQAQTVNVPNWSSAEDAVSVHVRE